MLTKAPSKQALRHLTQLCYHEPAHLRTSAISSFSQRCRTKSARIGPSIRTATTLRDAPEPSSFANDPSRYDSQNTRRSGEPKKQGTVDPQPAAQVLPDISNYYTLFPRTLPHGPPRPSSQRVPTVSTETSEPEQKGNEGAAPFHINPRDLRAEFLRLQSQHHPDKYPSNTPAHQKAYALSSLLNNAYKTLADPLLRGQYLLQLNYGIDVMSEDNSAHPTDQETLVEVMEAQESVEEATSQAEVDSLKEQNLARIKATEKKMSEAFEADDFEAAKNECVRLKYWVSLQQGLNDWEPGKEIRLVH